MCGDPSYIPEFLPVANFFHKGGHPEVLVKPSLNVCELGLIY